MMVHRGGFEPPQRITRQIYSLLPLTTRPPVHLLQPRGTQSPTLPPESIVDSGPSSILVRIVRQIALKEWCEVLRAGTRNSTTKSAQLLLPLPEWNWLKLELTKGFEPPTL